MILFCEDLNTPAKILSNHIIVFIASIKISRHEVGEEFTITFYYTELDFAILNVRNLIVERWELEFISTISRSFILLCCQYLQVLCSRRVYCAGI